MPADNSITNAETSVRAKGEVKVWLTAAGLATGLMMVVSLLLLIGVFDTHPLRSYLAVCVGLRDYILRKRGKYQGSLLQASDS